MHVADSKPNAADSSSNVDWLTGSAVHNLHLRDYKDPFTLWSVAETKEEKNPYIPFYGKLILTPEQEFTLVLMQCLFSQAVIDAVPLLKPWLASKPVLTKKGKKWTGKRKRNQWQKGYNAYYRSLQKSLTASGWPKRLAVEILNHAETQLKTHEGQVKLHLGIAKQRHRTLKTNKTHSKLQYWESRKQCQHVCIGKKAELRKLNNPKLTAEERNKAKQAWEASRRLPLGCMGDKAGDWLNKTMFLRIKAPGVYEFEVKLHRSFAPPVPAGAKPPNPRWLPSMVVPVKLNAHSEALFQQALELKQPISYYLVPHKSGIWKMTGVFKEKAVPKLPFDKDRRIGIDQNAGFITVALVHGSKLVWVRKYWLRQIGSSRFHEERMAFILKEICDLAARERALIIIEDLHFAHKIQDMKGKCTKRHVSRIPYRKFEDVLKRICLRQGTSYKRVNPAFSSVEARYWLPGMNVHLGAAAVMSWRDIGIKKEIFQVGKTCLKIQGQGRPLLVEVMAGMPELQSKLRDPRQMQAVYKQICHALADQSELEPVVVQAGMKGQVPGRLMHNRPSHADETDASPPRITHASTCPAAGTNPSTPLKQTLKISLIP